MAVRVAIWGAGKMGHLHGLAYRRIKEVEIVGVIENNDQKAKEFAELFHCMLFKTINEVPYDLVDAIDICLPTWMHSAAIKKASTLCRGIFCEKPICLNEQEFFSIQEVVKKTNCFVMIGQVLRFWNGYIKAKEILEEGILGVPRFITCRRRQKIPEWSAENWLMNTAQSGGILMDLSIHDVDYVYWILGEPKTVACQVVTKDDCTLHCQLTLDYEKCCAALTASWGMPEEFNEGKLEGFLEIVGDKGMLTYRGDNSLEIITDCGHDNIKLLEEDGYEKELKYFVDCIQYNKQGNLCDLNSVEGTMKILWAAEQAARNNEILSIKAERHDSKKKVGDM